MSRYIDAEPLEHRSPKLRALIKEQPTADVEPVRHGHWIADLTNPYGMRYICSECGVERQFKSNYCPNCGAKMDKEQENE